MSLINVNKTLTVAPSNNNLFLSLCLFSNILPMPPEVSFLEFTMCSFRVSWRPYCLYTRAFKKKWNGLTDRLSYRNKCKHRATILPFAFCSHALFWHKVCAGNVVCWSSLATTIIIQNSLLTHSITSKETTLRKSHTSLMFGISSSSPNT